MGLLINDKTKQRFTKNYYQQKWKMLKRVRQKVSVELVFCDFFSFSYCVHSPILRNRMLNSSRKEKYMVRFGIILFK